MPNAHVITTSYQEFTDSFDNLKGFVKEGELDDQKFTRLKDLPRSTGVFPSELINSVLDCESTYYSQGNYMGGPFGQLFFQGIKMTRPSDEDYYNYDHVSLMFLDDDKIRSISIVYNKADPDKWILSILDDCNAHPSVRPIKFFMSDSLYKDKQSIKEQDAYRASNNSSLEIKPVNISDELSQIQSINLIENLFSINISQLFDSEGKINITTFNQTKEEINRNYSFGGYTTSVIADKLHCKKKIQLGNEVIKVLEKSISDYLTRPTDLKLRNVANDKYEQFSSLKQEQIDELENLLTQIVNPTCENLNKKLGKSKSPAIDAALLKYRLLVFNSLLTYQNDLNTVDIEEAKEKLKSNLKEAYDKVNKIVMEDNNPEAHYVCQITASQTLGILTNKLCQMYEIDPIYDLENKELPSKEHISAIISLKQKVLNHLQPDNKDKIVNRLITLHPKQISTLESHFTQIVNPTCKKLKDKLHKSKSKNIDEPINAYKKSVFNSLLTYQCVVNAGDAENAESNLKDELKKSYKSATTTLKIDRNPVARRTLMVLTNALCMATGIGLIFNLANKVKNDQFFFFSTTNSHKSFRSMKQRLNQQVFPGDEDSNVLGINETDVSLVYNA